MHHNIIRLLAAMMLIPSLFFGLMPAVVAHTNLLGNLHAFQFSVLGHQVAQYHRDVNGTPVAESSRQVWLVAVCGEVMLLALSVFKPTQVDRSKLSIRD
jgi:hypothetical protein